MWSDDNTADPSYHNSYKRVTDKGRKMQSERNTGQDNVNFSDGQ